MQAKTPATGQRNQRRIPEVETLRANCEGEAAGGTDQEKAGGETEGQMRVS